MHLFVSSKVGALAVGFPTFAKHIKCYSTVKSLGTGVATKEFSTFTSSTEPGIILC